MSVSGMGRQLGSAAGVLIPHAVSPANLLKWVLFPSFPVRAGTQGLVQARQVGTGGAGFSFAPPGPKPESPPHPDIGHDLGALPPCFPPGASFWRVSVSSCGFYPQPPSPCGQASVAGARPGLGRAERGVASHLQPGLSWAWVWFPSGLRWLSPSWTGAAWLSWLLERSDLPRVIFNVRGADVSSPDGPGFHFTPAVLGLGVRSSWALRFLFLLFLCCFDSRGDF